jgi:hypothetical protein
MELADRFYEQRCRFFEQAIVPDSFDYLFSAGVRDKVGMDYKLHFG